MVPAAAAAAAAAAVWWCPKTDAQGDDANPPGWSSSKAHLFTATLKCIQGDTSLALTHPAGHFILHTTLNCNCSSAQYNGDCLSDRIEIVVTVVSTRASTIADTRPLIAGLAAPNLDLNEKRVNEGGVERSRACLWGSREKAGRHQRTRSLVHTPTPPIRDTPTQGVFAPLLSILLRLLPLVPTCYY